MSGQELTHAEVMEVARVALDLVNEHYENTEGASLNIEDAERVDYALRKIENYVHREEKP